MACGADQVLAKPGMGVDEGMMIVGNEMARTSALTSTAEHLPMDHAEVRWTVDPNCSKIPRRGAGLDPTAESRRR